MKPLRVIASCLSFGSVPVLSAVWPHARGQVGCGHLMYRERVDATCAAVTKMQ